ncbi:Reverse transcriptase (RNA-dependent DNA polymerase) [bacterium]|nr:Reverse transcriptase (RNA-dependent DNA polymerase) [bacterium]
MSREVYKDKYYTHFDEKKHHKDYEKRVENIEWVGKHGFYPFIHFRMKFNKYTNDTNGNKYIKLKERDIYYAAHIDRYIYEYYGNRLNNKYNSYLKKNGTNRASIAYRNCTPGKCNIDFAKEVFEFIVNCETAYIFVGDFSKFFDNLDHKYLKEKIKSVIGKDSLDVADYAIYKNLIHFSYIEADDIEAEKGKLRRDMREMDKYFETAEFHEIKKKHLKTNSKNYQIPQGSSISAVYANVYMVDFDKKINDFVTSHHGMYRRYCDDIIMIIPMTKEEVLNGADRMVDEFVYAVRDEIPNLDLNEDKTEHFFYNNGKVEKIMGASNLINYLGFTFDGKNVRIREKSLFKYYCRAYRKIERVKKAKDEKAFNAGRKAIYQSYTHLGVGKNPREHGNFLTYAYKADKIFSQSKELNCEIRNQVKRHWQKIENRLKE